MGGAWRYGAGLPETALGLVVGAMAGIGALFCLVLVQDAIRRRQPPK